MQRGIMEINRNLEKQDGMTLVELVVVLILLVPMLLVILDSLERSMRTSDQVYRLTTCAFLAQQKMEEVRTRFSCYTNQQSDSSDGLVLKGCPPRYGITNNPLPIGNPACPYPTVAAIRTNNFQFTFSQPRKQCSLADKEFATCGFPAPFTNFKCEVKHIWRTQYYVLDIQVRVWFDEQPNTTFDPSETNVLLQTDLTYRSPAWRDP